MPASTINKNNHQNFEANTLFMRFAGLSFQQITVGKQEKEKDHAQKIYDIAGIYHATAYAVVMKIDPKHFDIIIGTRLQRRYATDGIEPAVQYKTQKCAGNECYHRVIGKTAAANANGNENT